MADEATLKDVTTGESNPQVEAKPAEQTTPPETRVAVVDNEASEIGRLLMESGYTKERVSDLLQAPQALQSLRYLMDNNPTEFLNLLERTNPTSGEKFLETMADTYVKRYAPKDTSTGSPSKNTDVQAEMASLKEQLEGFRSAQLQRDQAAATAQVKSRYDARVEDLFGQLPKELNLTKAETKSLRARLNEELASDPVSMQRVTQGNFYDVPRKLQTILDEWSADRKSAAEAAKTAREASEKAARIEFNNGPSPFTVDVPTSATESWEATEDALAAALEKASR